MKAAHDRTNSSKRKGFENSCQSAFMPMHNVVHIK